MNSFIDSLLEVLLAWVKGVLNDLWTLLSGGSGSFFAWLGRHWLSLLCVLLVGGIAVDFIIYLLRWHPQRVWNSKLNRLFSRKSKEDAHFEEGYNEGIQSFELDSDPLISDYINAAPQFAAYEAAIPAQPQADDGREQTLPVRRRRSDRHHRAPRKHLIPIKLPHADDQLMHTPAQPAPPLHAREAFHTPVYPSDWPENNNHANN